MILGAKLSRKKIGFETNVEKKSHGWDQHLKITEHQNKKNRPILLNDAYFQDD